MGYGRYTMIALAQVDSALPMAALYWPHLVSAITAPSGKMVKKINPRGENPSLLLIFLGINALWPMSLCSSI